MASMWTVVNNLNEELVQSVMGLVPDGRPEHLFEPIEQWEGERPSGKIRGFYVEWGDGERITTGAAAMKYEIGITIVVGYPVYGWTAARVSDTDKIMRLFQLDGGQSATTGVSYRLVDPEEPPNTEIDEEWTWVSYPLTTVIETTE